MPSKRKIFLIEDDEFIANTISHYIELNPDNEVMWFSKGRDALDNLHIRPSIAIVDYALPDFKGDSLIVELRKVDPGIGIIVVSAQSDMQVAVDLLKQNIHDYIIKNKDLKSRLWMSLNGLLEKQLLRAEVKGLREIIAQQRDVESLLIGNSQAMMKIKESIQKVAKTNVTVSISGETGTGKEQVAKAVHHASDRSAKPFMAINLAAIPASLAESQLFGHEKGAFTGAMERKSGLFEQANKGTLFLDELQDLDIGLQAKLLRVLQESEVVRVGGSTPIKIDVRLVTASNKDLAEMVKEGSFREDLYYRLLGYQIKLPPLRERKGDVLQLAQSFMKHFELSNKQEKVLSEAAMEKLESYDYPGNVRELKAVVENACLLSSGKTVGKSNIVFRGAVKSTQSVYDQFENIKDFEVQAISFFLDKFKGNVKKAAERLGIGTTKIYDHLREKKGS